jgi:hypothetical protein
LGIKLGAATQRRDWHTLLVVHNGEPNRSSQTFSAAGLRVVEHARLGRHVVTDRVIEEREVVAIWRGYEITEATARSLERPLRDQLLQIGFETFLANDDDLCVVDFINHSCEPNCGFLDATTLAAMHRIEPGASITFDYAMSDSNSFISFDCECGSSRCRKRLKPDDWQSAELQQRYAGWFAPHIDQLIRQAINASPATERR